MIRKSMPMPGRRGRVLAAVTIMMTLLAGLQGGLVGRAQAEPTWTVLGVDPTAPGQFSSPSGVAVDGQANVYVADSGNHRIQKLSPAGEPLAQWGSEGSGPGQFREPAGVAVDGQGNVYVADSGNHRIQKLSPSGEPLAQWGSKGSGPGQFQNPQGVAVGRDGNVYVVDRGNGRIQKLTVAGQAQAPLVPPGMLAEVYPELRSLAAAPSFTITDQGGGLIALGSRGSGTTMVKEECTLTRTQTDVAGTCFGRAGVTRVIPTSASADRQYELPVQVPPDAAEHFLRELATMPVADGPYEPIRVADLRVHREFRIVSDAGTVRIFSDTPTFVSRVWAVEYGGRQMVVDSAAPWEAYQLLHPYLDELRWITQYGLDAMIRAPVPTASPSPVP